MTTITALEAKNRFGKLLERVARGEEVVITRHDKPVARVLPPKAPEAIDDPLRFVVATEEFRKIRERIRARTRGKQKVTLAEWKSAVAEGRR